MSRRQQSGQQLEAALQHRRTACQSAALAAWRQGIELQRTQHTRLQGIAARWSQRSVAQCWDAWREGVAHNQELRSRLSLAIGAHADKQQRLCTQDDARSTPGCRRTSSTRGAHKTAHAACQPAGHCGTLVTARFCIVLGRLAQSSKAQLTLRSCAAA